MRIGILGGTFNPIHLAHLRSAEEVRQAQQLERVLFIPSANPPHKRNSDVAPAAHRLAMVRAAIRGNPRFAVSSIELRRSGQSYSVDTLDALRRRQPRARFAFILGLDAFREIGSWHDYRRLFSLCDVIVTSRPDFDPRQLEREIPVAALSEFCYQPEANVLEHRSGHRVTFQPISALSISATQIRTLVRNRGSIRYLVPLAVERYIARHRLYTRRTATS